MTLVNFFKAFLSAYFLFGMHIILDTPGGTGLYLSYNIIAWLFVVMLIAFGLWQITINKKIYYSKMLIGLTLGYFCLLIPAFYHFEFTDHAIPRLLALTGGLLFLFSLYQFKFSKSEQTNMLWLIVIAVAIEASLGLAQFFIFEEGFWGGYQLGVSRPHGVFLQPNVMASFMATGLAIGLFLSVKKHKPVLPQPLLFLQQLAKPLLYFVLFSSSFLLVVLQSRTGYIGALLVIALLLPYLYKKNRQQLAINLLIIVLGVTSALASFNGADLPKRDSSIYQSVGARDIIFEVSADMVITKPLVGFGYGNFERSFIDHFNQYALINPDVGKTIERLSHPHNEVLFWVIEGGGMALIGFIFFTFAYINMWLKIPLTTALALLALILPILLHSQLEFPFYSSVSHFILFLLLLWLSDTYQQNSQEQQGLSVNLSVDCQKTFLIRFLAILAPAIFIPFLVTSIHTAYILVEHEKSDHRSVQRLKDIVNPIAWQDRLDAAVFAHILVAGIIEKKTKNLERYISWGLKRVRYKPRANIYSNMLLALKMLNKKELYELLLKEAKQTYPQRSNWHEKVMMPERYTEF